MLLKKEIVTFLREVLNDNITRNIFSLNQFFSIFSRITFYRILLSLTSINVRIWNWNCICICIWNWICICICNNDVLILYKLKIKYLSYNSIYWRWRHRWDCLIALARTYLDSDARPKSLVWNSLPSYI